MGGVAPPPRIMAWFRRKTDGSEGQASRVHIAEGLWIKCDSCKEIVYRAEVERAGRVCPKCLYPFRVSARERVALLADPGTFEERDTNLESTDPLGFRDTKKYRAGPWTPDWCRAPARLQGHQEIPRPHPRRRGEDEGRRGRHHRSGADRRRAERAVRVRVRIPRRQYGVGRR